MGFRMTWLLHGMHFALTLTLPFLLLVLMSCTKVKEEKAEYGPEVSGAAINQALGKAIRGASLNNLHVGQMADYTIIRRLENEETTTVLGATKVELIKEDDMGSWRKFTLAITRAERNTNGGFDLRTTEDWIETNKSTTSNELSASQLTTQGMTSKVRPMSKVTNVTFHNLREFEAPFIIPAKVLARPDCGGLSPCAMTVRYVLFDMVQWYDDAAPVKVSMDFGFSIDTPFLPFGQEESFDQLSGLMVTDCRATYVPIEHRTVYVRDCMNLEDFQK